MRFCTKRPTGSAFPRRRLMLAVVVVACAVCVVYADGFDPDLYAPYQDLPYVIKPADKAVLMD